MSFPFTLVILWNSAYTHFQTETSLSKRKKSSSLFCLMMHNYYYCNHFKFRQRWLDFDLYPVKNVIWIPMEIPCHFTSQIDGSLVQIDPKFHDYSMSFIQDLFVVRAQTWHGSWTSSSHGISMAFAKKMMGFPVRIWSHFRTRPNCRQSDMRKSVSHFLHGDYVNL